MEYQKHEFNLFPEIIGDELKELSQSISKGFDKTFPIMLYEGKIIDGWNRYKACQRFNIQPFFKQFEGTREEALNFILRSNKRRNLTSSQWACLSLEYLPIFEKEAKERQACGQGGILLSQKIEQANKGKAAEKITEHFETNRQYVYDAKKLKDWHPEKFKEVLSGIKNIAEVKREIKHLEVMENLENIEIKEVKKVSGLFDVIVIDPPWDMQKIERNVAPEQIGFDYPTMTIDQIKLLEIPAFDNCHVWLWTTQKYLPESFDILKSWGLKYVLTFVWHKNGGFQPFNLPQYNCEFALYARKGSPSFIDLKDFNSCFSADRTKHSEKPEAFYDMVRRVTGGRRLDMFNRRKIEGFETWGNQCQ